MPFDGARDHARATARAEIDAVIALLSSGDRWCQRTLRSGDGRLCILGAVLAVHRGRASLTEPILQAIHQVTGCRHRRVEAFNDDPSTTHGLVLRVLHQAGEFAATDTPRGR